MICKKEWTGHGAHEDENSGKHGKRKSAPSAAILHPCFPSAVKCSSRVAYFAPVSFLDTFPRLCESPCFVFGKILMKNRYYIVFMVPRILTPRCNDMEGNYVAQKAHKRREK